MLDNNVNESLIGWLRHARKTVAGIASVVTLTFLSLVLSPTMVAARQMWDEGLPKSAQSSGPSVEAQFSRTVLQLKKHLQRIADRLERDEGPPEWVTFKQLRRDLERLNGKILKRFERLEEHIQSRGLPPVILDRHLEAVDRYETEIGTFTEELSAIASAENEGALEEAVRRAIEHLESVQLEASHQPFDPSNLPFGTPEDRPDAPGESGKALMGRLSKKEADLEGGSFDLAGKAMPSDADLAETQDIQLTPAIEAKAAELNHDPIAIYNWVRNHVEFVPSYGSIQGANQTLEFKRGNAFDTASLLIALLRASDIPARYAYGTATAPADRVMNWVGGVDVPEAAMSLMGQGGIPNEGLSRDGVITDIRFEHVWVEAWVDYEPSRGAIHVEGDTWVSLDASFKQYDYQEGMDIAEAVPFDAQDFAGQLENAATVNEEEGWVQGVDQALIEDKLSGYQAQVEDYIDSQNPDATVGEVLGSREIVAQELKSLPASLPYDLTARTNAFTELPDRLRWQFRYQLQDRFGGTVFTFEESLPTLAGKKLALSFRPASAEDQEVIESYLPEPPQDGSSLDPEDLPTSLPGYLIHVVPEWTVDGDVHATGGEFTLGEELRRKTALKPPSAAWQSRTKYLVAGEYQAVGLDAQGLPASQFSELQANLKQVRSQLANQEFAGLTRHDLTGNLLQTGIWSWFALNDFQNQVAARAAGVVTERLPSIGAFQLNLETNYSFGIPNEVTFPGILMDIGYSKLQIAATNNDRQVFVKFNRIAGFRGSANEHAVPEQLFSTSENSIKGISAVKAIALAASQGQRIYTITEGNLNQALKDLTLDSNTEEEIRAAVKTGLLVTTHQHSLSYAGFQGAGYIILDPKTGSGAYKITGGSNGGEILDALGTLLMWLGGALTLAAEALASVLLGALEKIMEAFGLIIDFSRLLAACDLTTSLGVLLSTIFLEAGILLKFSAVFLLAHILSALVVTAVMVVGAIVAALVGNLVIDRAVEGCKEQNTQ